MQIKHTIAGIVLALSSLTVHAQKIDFWIAQNEKFACFSSNVKFNMKLACPDGIACYYEIDYGDEKSDSLPITDTTPRHLYENDGIYTVNVKMLKVADKSEIMNKTFNSVVTVYSPESASINDSVGEKSYIVNYSVGDFKPADITAWHYDWTFHDGEKKPMDSLTQVITKEYLKESQDSGYLVTLVISMLPGSQAAINLGPEKALECTDTISRNIKVTDCFFDYTRPLGDGFWPDINNVILPDGDPNGENSVNEVFKIYTNGHDVFSLTIFNNYGNVVYTQTGKDISWTGVTNSGRRVKSGTYYYAVESNAGGDKHRNTGFIQVFNKDM